MRALPLLPLALCLAGCVTVRTYSDPELAGVAQACGLAPGDVIQEPDYPKILFLLASEPTPAQFACVKRWSRKHNLHLSYISGIEFQSDAPSH